MRPDIEQVPVDRLVSNLEKKLEANPNDLQGLYALGRVHAMAYALGLEQFDVLKDGGTPFFGHGNGSTVPPTVQDPAKAAKAVAHLKQAIAYYQQAVKVDPEHLPSQLGLGWALEQAGDKQAALAAYRRAFKLAWAGEQQGVFGLSMTEEAGRYLLNLLDKEKDAKEVAEVGQVLKEVAEKPRAVTPLVIPLEPAAGLDQLVDPKARVEFDLDGSGEQRGWGWTTPQAGWLVYDPQQTGRITSGLQMFGAVSFWVFWKDGYQALGALDDNHDGQLLGGELAGLAVWRDANQNGQSEAGEVLPLRDWNITGLSCRSETHPSGIPFSPQGVTLGDGSTRPSFDWSAPATR